MTHAIAVLEFLDDIKPRAECDDCLSEELDIRPRQTVNQVCRVLADAQKIERVRSTCHRCGSVKLTNAFGAAAMPMAPREYAVSSVASAVVLDDAVAEPLLDVEKARTEIVRICRAIWQEAKTVEAPRSLGGIIHTLRIDGVIPNHQANMMQVLCNLRNVHVYEGLELGEREITVAVNARDIVMEWWNFRLREM